MDFRNSDLSSARGADSQQVVELLRNIATGKVTHIGTASFVGVEARVALLRLGDDLTIQSTVDIYQEKFKTNGPDRGMESAMEWSKQPKIIPYLGLVHK